MPNSCAFSWKRPNSSYFGAGVTASVARIAAALRKTAYRAGRDAIRRLRSMHVPRLSSGGFRRLTTVNLVLLVAIIVSGAVVRLTNSGLGCRDWPNCSADQFVNVSTHHALIEQLNRIFSGAIGILIALALVSVALRMRQLAREIEGPRVPIVTPLALRAVGVVYVWTIAAVIA